MNMKKYVFSVGFIFLCAAFGVAQNANTLLRDFVKINNAFNVPQALLMEQVLARFSMDNTKLDESSVYSLYSKGRQITKLRENNSDVYFLSLENGYWIKNRSLRSPLKISGNYKVEQLEVQDIFRIDIEANYRVLELDTEEETLLLERSNAGMAYPFIKMHRLPKGENGGDVFEMTFLDRSRKSIRTVIYRAGVVDGYYCFKKITVYNLLFDTRSFGEYTTSSIREAIAPQALFRETQMDQLILYMENMLK
jgi:hypothetical protein